MRVSGDQLIFEIDDIQAVYPVTIDPRFIQQQGFSANDLVNSDQFGNAVAISGETAVVGVGMANLSNSDQGSAYVFIRTGATWTQQQKLTGSDSAAGDNFGQSVGISGETLVVGAHRDVVLSNLQQGSAYVFVRNGTTWTQQQKLTSSDGASGDNFGVSVGINRETIVVGAWLHNISANADQGAAYVFSRSGTTWAQQQKLTAGDGAANDWFGLSVGISDETVIVGAPAHNLSANADQGAAYVFLRTGTTWAQQQKLTAGDGAANDNFGRSVAIDRETVVVGSNGNNGGLGAAYVYLRAGATWSLQQKLAASDGAGGDEFGFAVAISGERIVVGAPNDDIGANADQGSAYVFVRAGTTWSELPKIYATNGAATDRLGRAVAITGETALCGAPFANGAGADRGVVYAFTCTFPRAWSQQSTLIDTLGPGSTNDGTGQSIAISGETVVVGSPLDSVGANSLQGSASVFVRSGTTWTQQAFLVAGAPAPGAASDFFGISVAIDGETIVVGASSDDVGANTNQGSAYVFVRNGTTWTQQTQLVAQSPAAGAMNDIFGASVAIQGETIAVGAINDDVGANSNQGSAYVYVRSGTTWTQQQHLTASDGATNDALGGGIAISGETLVVGVGQDDVGANVNQGSAYVFVRSGTTWTQQQQLTAGDGAAQDLFGSSVAIDNQTIVVGAEFDDVGANVNQGSAYVFVRNGTTWTQQQQLTAGDGSGGDQLGAAVGISGERVVVGVRSDDIGANADQGSAYVFVRSGTTWTQEAQLTESGGSGNDSFGTSVTISGGTVAVTVIGDDVGANANQGSAAVFVLNCDCPTVTGMVTGGGLICPGGNTTVTVTVSGGAAPYTVTLNNGGGTQTGNGPTFTFTVSPLTPTTYSLQSGTGAGGCPITGSGSAPVTINSGTVNAGLDQSVCSSNPVATLAGAIGGSATTGTWSGGGGTFTPNATTLNAVYTLSAGEITAGSVTLTLTATGVCAPVQDTMTITISPEATVNAGLDQNVCLDTPAVNLNGVIGGGASNGTWSGGAGTFAPNNTTVNAVYTPSAGELSAGSVTLTLTTNDPPGPCGAVSDTVTITFADCRTLLVVADTINNRIQRFDGIIWDVIGVGTVGNGNGQFRQPEAVTFGSNRRIYVADTGNNRIQWSTDSGLTWANFATLGSGLNQVRAPQGVAVDTGGNLYVSDTGNSRVLRFNGGVPGTGVVIASTGVGSGQVSSPRGLVVDSTFRLFVTDETNSRILRILNANTTVSPASGAVLASNGVGMNQVKNPQGITIDATGTLFVADTGNSRILRWPNANPANATTMALVGSQLGQVTRPEGVTISQFPSGPFAGSPVLVVGDTGNNRIQGRFLPTGQWNLIGVPNGIGTGIGQFRSPSKIR